MPKRQSPEQRARKRENTARQRRMVAAGLICLKMWVDEDSTVRVLQAGQFLPRTNRDFTSEEITEALSKLVESLEERLV